MNRVTDDTETLVSKRPWRFRVRLFGQRVYFRSLLEALEFHQDLANNGLDVDCILVDQASNANEIADNTSWETINVPEFLHSLRLLLAPREGS